MNLNRYLKGFEFVYLRLFFSSSFLLTFSKNGLRRCNPGCYYDLREE